MMKTFTEQKDLAVWNLDTITSEGKPTVYRVWHREYQEVTADGSTIPEALNKCKEILRIQANHEARQRKGFDPELDLI